jgi:hypothetical protein
LETLEDRTLLTVHLLSNFKGLDTNDAGGVVEPPDTIAAAGPTDIVEIVNSNIAYYDKATGNRISTESLSTFFAPVDTIQSLFSDVYVFYDESVGRFFVSTMDIDFFGLQSYFDFAVSNDSDPTHGFTEMHQINTSETSSRTGEPLFTDFPRVGWNADAYVISFNQYGFNTEYQYNVQLLTIDKSTVLDQNPATLTYYQVDRPLPNSTMVPATMHGATAGGPLWFVEEKGLEQDGQYVDLRVVQMTNVLSSTPSFTDYYVGVAPYTITPFPGDTLGQVSTALDTRILSADWRNNQMAVAQDVGIASDTNVHAAWYLLSTSGSAPSLLQQGIISPGSGADTYMPCVALGTDGGIGMTFIQSSPTQDMSMYVTGRRATDSAGTMQRPVVVKGGEQYYQGTRVGDFSGITVDPSDGTTYWAANEYAISTTDLSLPNWGTWIGKFNVVGPSQLPGAVDNPISSGHDGSLNFPAAKPSQVREAAGRNTASLADGKLATNSGHPLLDHRLAHARGASASRSPGGVPYQGHSSGNSGIPGGPGRFGPSNPLLVSQVTNFKGLDTNDAGGIVEPPDTIAAAGPTDIVEIVNSNIAYYDKTTGNRIFTEDLGTFFSPVDTVQSLFSDVYVTYDESVGRFFVSTMDIDFFGIQSYFDFAVSNDSDPTHGFTEMHQINTTETSSQTGEPLFTDFPRVGWNADAYVISFNIFGFLTQYPYNVQLLTIDKSSVLDKNPATLTYYQVDRPLPNSTMVPASMHGATAGGPLWFVEEKGLEQDGEYLNLRIVQMTNVLSNNPTFTDYYVTVPAYTITPFPGDTQGQVSFVLDTRILSVDWRGDQMVIGQDIGIASDTNVHAAWYLVSTSGSAPALVQQGALAPAAGTDTYMPSAALGTDGSIGMTYIESSPTEDMSMYVTGRLPSDPAGTMETGVLVKAGEQYYQGTRIGDFSGLAVDPNSGTTYWAANEYAISTTDLSLPNWGTWIGEFNLGGTTAGNTTTTVTSDQSSGSTYGQVVDFTATVSPVPPAQGTPTGTVQFQIDGSNFGNPVTLSGGSATISTGSLAAGSHTVSAIYSGDSNFASSTGTLSGGQSVNPAPLTISADNQSMTYGGTLPTLTATYTGLVNGDTPATFTISPNTPPVLSTVPATSHAGSYTISITGAYDPNYTISYATGTLTINPAPLTITADNQSMVYGGTLPTLTATYTGLVNGDTPATFNTSPNVPPTLSTVPAASPVGSYVISVSGAVDSDYTITFVNGTLTITAASLTITADNQSMTYGGTLPTLTATYTGLVNGDTPATFTVSPNTPPVLSTVPASSHAGSYTISISGAYDPNYTISYVNGTLTINPAPLTITADNQSMVYGGTLPTLTATFTGLVNGDTAATFNVSPNVPPALSTVPATSPVGSYAISVSGAMDSDYTITFVSGTLTITAASLIISADNQSMTYGGTLPTLTATYTGLVNGDTPATFAISPNTPPVLSTVPATSHAGNYTISVSGAYDPNYTISYVNGTLTINPAPLTIAAANQSMVYGGTLPTLTATYTGLVNGDTPATFNTSPNVPPALSTVPATSHAGTYAITVSGAVDPDYAISYVNGTLTITPAPLTITADNQSRVYGAPNPTFTASYSGFVNGDTPASLTTPPSFATTATVSSPVGTYPITVSGATDPDYTITFVSGTLTIVQDTATPTGSPSANPSYFGQTLTLTATVTADAPGSGTPTGTVDFFDSTTATDLGTVTLSSGMASVSMSTLPPGSQTITLSYSGDGNFLAGTGTLTATIVPSVYVLDATSNAALGLGGSSSIQIGGLVQVDSSSGSALVVQGTAQVQAGSIQVVGGYHASSTATLSPTPVTGVASVPDPLAGLPIPSVSQTRGVVNLTSGSLTINPGIYLQISVSGTGSLTLNPGIYVIAGGGLSVTSSASISGTGVMIYNAGSNYVGHGSSFGPITLTGQGTISLTPSSTGTYAGIAIFQSRDNTRAARLNPAAVQAFAGSIFYAPAATVGATGNAHVVNTFVVDRLQMTGSISTRPVSTIPSNGQASTGGNSVLGGMATPFTPGPALVLETSAALSSPRGSDADSFRARFSVQADPTPMLAVATAQPSRANLFDELAHLAVASNRKSHPSRWIDQLFARSVETLFLTAEE